MLSDRYFKLFDLELKLVYILGGVPFKWCEKERRIFSTNFSYFKYAFNYYLLAAYALFTIVQLIRYYRMGKSNEFYYCFLYAILACGIFTMVAAYPLLRKPKFAAAFINEFWRFLDEIATDFMPTYDPNHSCLNKFFDALIAIVGIACPTCGFLISCHHIFFPHWPCYFSSLVSPEDLNWPILIFSILIYMYVLQFVWSVILIMVAFLFPYGWYTWQICNEYYCFNGDVRGPPGQRARRVWRWQKTSQKFRSFEQFPLRYRQLQVLHLAFQEVFSCMIFPIQATITNLVVFCNFTLIKYRNAMPATNTAILLLWTIGATVVALIALTFCGTMYNKSVRALATVKKADWGSKYKNMLMSKFVLSCFPISYGYGRMYVIRMLSVFRFIKHLTRGTFRALLTLTRNK